MTRQQYLDNMKAAGARGDKATFTRLYIESRVSLQAANQAWRDGLSFGRFIAQRDAAKAAPTT